MWKELIYSGTFLLQSKTWESAAKKSLWYTTTYAYSGSYVQYIDIKDMQRGRVLRENYVYDADSALTHVSQSYYEG